MTVRIEKAEYEGLTADAEGWKHHAWKVTLEFQGRRMETPFKMGVRLEDEPTARDIMESLLLDCSGYKQACGNFETWADEYGYDSNSRKIKALYKEVARQSSAVVTLLDDEYGPATDNPEEWLERHYGTPDES